MIVLSTPVLPCVRGVSGSQQGLYEQIMQSVLENIPIFFSYISFQFRPNERQSGLIDLRDISY